MNEKHKKVTRVLNLSIFLFPLLLSLCVSISAFALIISIPLSIVNSAVELKICTITAVVKLADIRKK